MATTIVEDPTASVTCSQWDLVTTLDRVVRLILDLPVTITDQWDATDHPVHRTFIVEVTITDQWDVADHPVRRTSIVEATITDQWDVTAHRISTAEAPVNVPTSHAAVK